MTAEALVAALKDGGHTLAVAESCTGGLLGGAITSVPGASQVFIGGVIAYDDAVKTALLDVPADKIGRAGAVSASVAEAMAHGVRDRLHTDMAIAVTGVAGPSGGRSGKDVGTVWIAVLGPGHLLDVERFDLPGDRSSVRDAAVQHAITMALDVLAEAKAEAQ